MLVTSRAVTAVSDRPLDQRRRECSLLWRRWLAGHDPDLPVVAHLAVVHMREIAPIRLAHADITPVFDVLIGSGAQPP